jgi:uncharacterized protein (DUF1330 family)
MPAYVIAQLTVTDIEGFEAYRKAALPIVAAHGGRFLVSGGKVSSIEGDPARPRAVILEFANKTAAEGFYNSPEYQAILPMRQNNAIGSVMIVEGGV